MKMLKLLLTSILLAFPATALADIVVFKDGSRIEGEVVEEGQKIRIKLDCGDMAVPKNQIDHVVKCDTPRQEFKKKLAATDAGDVEALGKLKEWCTQNRLEKESAQIAEKISRLVLEKKSAGLNMKKAEDVFDMALWCQRNGYGGSVVDSYLWKVVSLEPDHAAAREMLGYRKFRGQWLKKEEVEKIEQAEYDREMRLKGMVKHDGQWLKPDAVAVKRQMEKLEREREDLDRERDRLEDDAREQAKEKARLESLKSELYTESCRLRQWESTLERTALNQSSLARQLAWDRTELDRMKTDIHKLREELKRDRKKIEEDRKEADREKDRLEQLRRRMEWELHEQRRREKDSKDCRSETERPKNPNINRRGK